MNPERVTEASVYHVHEEPAEIGTNRGPLVPVYCLVPIVMRS